MYEFLLSAISCLFIFQGGVFSEECSQGVIGKRMAFFAPAGSSLSLSCVVQHCGGHWTGYWIWENQTDSTSAAVTNSARHDVTSVTLDVNKTKLDLKIVNVVQSDEGVAFQRTLLHRALVCICAFLCLPVILGLARCLSSEVKPQPHPRIEVLYAAERRDSSHEPPQPPPRRPVPKKRTAPPQKAPQTSQQKPEVG
ncbi:hypothetical protein CHARACLAT_009716 [Characodon lateralis]|uniref:Immunoglobulin V-set domain-containing protein n=1 Tax=Characodon lateralis TaxID=208331 RepID=A0ABU7D8E6_9TELE|nr:hypothetical protein [Characodon lateralis]